MRRGCLAFLMLFSLTVTASAQTSVRLDDASAPNDPSGPEMVVARLMVFDANRDGRVAPTELNERMRSLVTRGDLDGNGALDRSEIHSLASAPEPTATIPGLPLPGRYGFGDRFGVSSRSQIEGAVDDLRLTTSTRNQVLGVVNAFMDSLPLPSAAGLLAEMESLLAPEQFADFRTVLERQRRGRVRTFNGGAETQTTISETNIQMVVTGTDLERRIAAYRLSDELRQNALAAVQEYKHQLLPGDAERTILLDRLTGILSREDGESLWAALQRRPVIKVGGGSGVATGVALSDLIERLRAVEESAQRIIVR